MTKVAVVIPCYRVQKHICGVISSIGDEVQSIYVIDDACPEGSGDFVRDNVLDDRVTVVWHEENAGVGGAVLTGYAKALSEGADIVVKIDGDGQMDPSLINEFVAPIARGEADYTKGNRFYDLEKVSAMPKLRLFGNAVLSFMTKFSSGYWNIFDPTNGYTAIHKDLITHLPFSKISKRYFFETDMLFRLNTLRAVVVDIPMDARYEDEVSNLKISDIVGEFLRKHLRNFFKRIFYNYYLRDMSIASIELPVGILMIMFGIFYGVANWTVNSGVGVETSAGTVMLAALPIIIGLQLILAFLSFDMSSTPRRIVHRR
ncbi:glycosyltransferase family 2 protein [Marinobacter arenosus]|uniref:glycosyltransferase family 2 protein n=1 Tax=Marinobacter arenosus TaxID=2856822 RepID=UPI001C4DD82D|nr:glycosyltransferase family 2 protein [Marinobacter arenosus]MBW0146835.1 glycosyltransferase family 2 protein [Marinobacter arenosus]